MRMQAREFLKIIFYSWGWIIGGLMDSISLLAFIYPDWQPYLTGPKIFQLFPWYWWMVVGVIIWALVIAWRAAGIISDFKSKLAALSLNGTASSYHDLALAWLAPSEWDREQKPTLVLRGSMPIRRYNLSKNEMVVPQAEFLHVEFVNNYTLKTDNIYKVRANVTFFSAQTKHITHDFAGRWEGAEPKYEDYTWEEIEKSKDLLEVDIPVDGFTKLRLNIAVRYDNDSFAFNNDWYKSVEMEALALPEKQYYVRVRLMGQNINPSEHWLELINGKNETTLTPLKKPLSNSVLNLERAKQ